MEWEPKGKGLTQERKKQVAGNPKRLKGRKGSFCMHILQRFAHATALLADAG